MTATRRVPSARVAKARAILKAAAQKARAIHKAAVAEAVEGALTVEEMASRCGVTKQTIYNWARAGLVELPPGNAWARAAARKEGGHDAGQK